MPTVREMASDVPVGGSRSGLQCPRCRGGASGEGSLSITREANGIFWKCHRASCNNAGFRSSVPGPASVPVSFTPRPYPFNLTFPPHDHEIWDRLQWSETGDGQDIAELGLYARADDSREIVWEVRDFDWLARGHISRTYPGKFIRTWKTVNGPWTGYHGFNRTRTIWIVEDMVSAARIALEGGNALALLGTGFSVPEQRELGHHLARFQDPRIRVALDPDAAGEGERMARELTFRLGYDTLFVPLVQDPKDLPGPELRRMIQENE